MAQRYGIVSLDEARAYLAHPLLGPRLRECTALVIDAPGIALSEVLEPPDDLKFCSSMTLFDAASDGADSIFRRALERWCGGREDPRTLALI